VKTVSIDEYINGMFTVDFIKMDIQGSELPALKGMKETVRNNPGMKILTEFWPYGFSQSGTSAGEAFRFIQSLGLKIFLFKDKNLEEISIQDIEIMGTGYFDYYNVLLAAEK